MRTTHSFSGTMVTVAATRSFLRFFRPRDEVAAARAPLAERRVVWQDTGAPAPAGLGFDSNANNNIGGDGGVGVGLARHEVMVCVCCLRPDSGGVLSRDVMPDYNNLNSNYSDGHGWVLPSVAHGQYKQNGRGRAHDDIEATQPLALDKL